MAYTAYRTWTTGEIVTAALMNEQVRDNGLLTAPAIMTGAGDLIYSSAANTPTRLAKDTNSTRVLTNTGTSNIPAWAQVTLTSGVTGTLPVANGGTNLTSLGSGVATFMGTPSSANLRGALTDETGTGSAVFATSPTLVTPALGTPASGVLTNATGLPEAGLAVSNSPTNGYMLTAQSGDAGGMTWAAASAGAVTREGGNTTEATTTSFTAVDLLSLTSLTPDITRPLMVMAGVRRSTSNGASSTAVGLKINATIINEADIGRSSFAQTHMWASGSQQILTSGSIFLLLGSQVTNYLGGVQSGYGANQDSGADGQAAWSRAQCFSSFMPGAAVTSIIFRAEGEDVATTDPTIGMDEAHAYSLADS